MLLQDDQWVRIETLLQGKAGDRGRSGTNNRLFIETVLWIARMQPVARSPNDIRFMEQHLCSLCPLGR